VQEVLFNLEGIRGKDDDFRLVNPISDEMKLMCTVLEDKVSYFVVFRGQSVRTLESSII